MATFDSLNARAVPCPGCAKAVDVAIVTYLFNAFGTAFDLYPGQAVQREGFEASEFFVEESLSEDCYRVRAATQELGISILFDRISSDPCACGAALAPLVALEITQALPRGDWEYAIRLGLLSIELVDVFQLVTLRKVDFVHFERLGQIAPDLLELSYPARVDRIAQLYRDPKN